MSCSLEHNSIAIQTSELAIVPIVMISGDSFFVISFAVH
jgi:hypothetical protein